MPPHMSFERDLGVELVPAAGTLQFINDFPLLRVTLIPLSSLASLLSRPALLLLLLLCLLHELVWTSHPVDAPIELHAWVSTCAHRLESSSRSKELLSAHRSSATLMMHHGNLWGLHLLWVR